MKHDATVRIRSCDHIGDAKKLNKGTLLRRI